MTDKKYTVSSKKPLNRLILTIFPLLMLAFAVGFYASSTYINEEETIVNVTKLAIVSPCVFVGLCLAVYFFCRAYTKSERFYFEDNKLHYFFTFIIKKRVSLPLEKINIIKVKRSLIDLIIGTSTVEIGSGSMTTSIRAEIKLCLNKEKAQYVADFLQRYSKAVKENKEFNEDFSYPTDLYIPNNTANSVTVKMTKADKVKYIFTAPVLWAMLVCMVALIFLPYAIRHFAPAELIETDFNDFVLSMLILSIVSFVITLISTVCYAFIGFYNYTVTRKGDEIIIHYGLINVKTFSVSFDKIHGFTIGQSFFRQIFKLGSLRLSVIGIDEAGNNNTASTTYVYPCGNINKIKEIIAALLPEFTAETKLIKSTKQSLLHTVLIPNAFKILVLSPVLIYLAVALSVWALIIPVLTILILGVLNSLLVYKHAGFSIDNDFIYAVSGGFFKKHTLIKTGSVQEISTFAGFIRRSQKLCTYLVVFRGSSLLSNKLLIRNIPQTNLDSLK